MNDDALAAVMAAARLLIARRRSAGTVPAEPIARWALAGRLALPSAAAARRAARAASRWTIAGRLGG